MCESVDVVLIPPTTPSRALPPARRPPARLTPALPPVLAAPSGAAESVAPLQRGAVQGPSAPGRTWACLPAAPRQSSRRRFPWRGWQRIISPPLLLRPARSPDRATRTCEPRHQVFPGLNFQFPAITATLGAPSVESVDILHPDERDQASLSQSTLRVRHGAWQTSSLHTANPGSAREKHVDGAA